MHACIWKLNPSAHTEKRASWEGFRSDMCLVVGSHDSPLLM